MTGHGVADFQFIEASHSYSRGGIIIPGCTRCIDHAGLTNYDDVRGDILERRSRLGRDVHSATHYKDENDLDWSSVAEEAKGYVDSWLEWVVVTGFQMKAIEHQQIATIHGMPVGMKLDRYGLLRKRSAVVEIKITREIQEWHAIQLAIYAAGYTAKEESSLGELARFLTRDRVAVRLRSDGKLAHQRYFEDRKDFDVATWALGITHWKLAHGRKLREETDDGNDTSDTAATGNSNDHDRRKAVGGTF